MKCSVFTHRHGFVREFCIRGSLRSAQKKSCPTTTLSLSLSPPPPSPLLLLILCEESSRSTAFLLRGCSSNDLGWLSDLLQPTERGAHTWGEKGCFWPPFPQTGCGSAPVRVNGKTCPRIFSSRPNEPLGDRNGHVPVRGPKGNIRAQPLFLGDAGWSSMEAASRAVQVPV